MEDAFKLRPEVRQAPWDAADYSPVGLTTPESPELTKVKKRFQLLFMLVTISTAVITAAGIFLISASQSRLKYHAVETKDVVQALLFGKQQLLWLLACFSAQFLVIVGTSFYFRTRYKHLLPARNRKARS